MYDITQIIIYILGAIILLISEILPFTKKIKSNGLVELIINSINTLKKSTTENIHNEDEEALLQIQTQDDLSLSDKTDLSLSLYNKIDLLNSSITNISYTLNNYINEAQNSRQLKLQTIELYELNYIINYIKVNYPKKMFQTKFLSKTNKQLLISQGYILDYDSQNDTHTIKW